MSNNPKKAKEDAFQKACPESAKLLKNHEFLTQFDKGSGSYRREQNIRKVADMLKKGFSEDDIRFKLGMLFKLATVDEYLRMAKECLKRADQP